MIVFDSDIFTLFAYSTVIRSATREINSQRTPGQAPQARPRNGQSQGREEREGTKMTAEHFEEVLDALTSRRPFKPFTVELHGGERIESDHPGAILWSTGNAIFRAPGGTLVFFDHDSVNKITDAPAHTARKKRT
jgi:hypothetical protein